jgi:hypothetical protein
MLKLTQQGSMQKNFAPTPGMSGIGAALSPTDEMHHRRNTAAPVLPGLPSGSTQKWACFRCRPLTRP